MSNFSKSLLGAEHEYKAIKEAQTKNKKKHLNLNRMYNIPIHGKHVKEKLNYEYHFHFIPKFQYPGLSNFVSYYNQLHNILSIQKKNNSLKL